MDTKLLEMNILQMTWAQRYAHVVSAYGQALNAKKGSEDYNFAVQVIKTHVKLLRDNQIKLAKIEL